MYHGLKSQTHDRARGEIVQLLAQSSEVGSFF